MIVSAKLFTWMKDLYVGKEITDLLKIKALLLTEDIEKHFHFADRQFLINAHLDLRKT